MNSIALKNGMSILSENELLSLNGGLTWTEISCIAIITACVVAVGVSAVVAGPGGALACAEVVWRPAATAAAGLCLYEMVR